MSLPMIERSEKFDLAYRFVTETSENIFLTGKAGTGKTTFLKYLKDNATKNIVVAAPTGVAAINAGGVTLHSLFQLPFHPYLPTKNNKDALLSTIRYNSKRQQLLRKMELLVIDEISMVRCDTMDAIDSILRSVRRNYDTPFGGVQLLCIGDLHQLPPVAHQQEWAMLQEYYTSPFFFDSLAIKEQIPLLIELDKIYRQKEDSFVRLLNKVRNNQMDADDFEDLHLRYDPLFSPMPGETFITLTSHNKQAAEINQQKIENLFTNAIAFTATIEGDFAENVFPADANLILKEGAQVMFLKNDAIGKRYFNGKIGIVKFLSKDKITVDCDGVEIEVGKETWENTKYTLNRTDGKLEQETLGTFTQYPLRLAWAITIHKSQGLTFEKVMIDAGASFTSGQVYVALSRCTSLQGIVLLSKLSAGTLFSNESVIKGQQSLTHRGSLADRFTGARQVFTQQLITEIFSFTDAEKAINNLQYHITQQQSKLNDDASNWIENIKKYFTNDKAVGLKFIEVANSILKDEPVIENNQAAQKRICDAANHFEPKFLLLQKNIQHHILITEHKETATIINESMLQLYITVNAIVYYLQYCKQPFAITTFLQHKLKYALPKVNITCYASSKKEAATDVANTELYETLKRWRNIMVEQENVPIYIIANQASLKEIATYLPLTKKDLLQITGFGKAKVDKYGDDILAAVESYCQQYNLQTAMFEKAIHPKKETKEKKMVTKVDTKALTFELYQSGKTIAEICVTRNLVKGTIEGHLVHFITEGKISVDDLVSKQKQQAIKDTIAIHGSLSHKILLDNLPKDIGYGDIKMVLAAEEKL
jgi:PIF1-like helicase/Helix-turn-helix domain/HRDC domain